MDEQMIEQGKLVVARAIARSHGLGDHMGDEHLKPWLRDGETAFRAAHSVIAGKVAEQQQRIEAAFVKGADVAVFIANQRQNPQPPTASQLNEIADFVATVRAAL